VRVGFWFPCVHQTCCTPSLRRGGPRAVVRIEKDRTLLRASSPFPSGVRRCSLGGRPPRRARCPPYLSVMALVLTRLQRAPPRGMPLGIIMFPLAGSARPCPVPSAFPKDRRSLPIGGLGRVRLVHRPRNLTPNRACQAGYSSDRRVSLLSTPYSCAVHHRQLSRWAPAGRRRCKMWSPLTNSV